MRKLTFIAFGMFTVGCSSTMIAGLLPFISQELNLSIALSAQGITVFRLCYFLSSLLFSLSFVNRSAKKTIQLALVLFMVGNLLTFLSQNLSLFILARAIAGVGAGGFTPIAISFALSISGELSRGKVLSFILGANSAGIVFLSPLGPYFSKLLGWQSCMVFLIALSVVSFIGLNFLKDDSSLKGSASLSQRGELLKDKKILSILGISCLTSFVGFGLYSYISLIHQGTPFSLSTALFLWGLGGFIGSSSVGYFIDRMKRAEVVMMVILIGMLLNFLLLPTLKEFNSLGWLPFFLWGAFGWAISAPQQHALFKLNESEMTILSALNSSAIGLGGALGSGVMGFLVSRGLEANHLALFATSLLFAVCIWQFSLTRNLKKGVLCETYCHS